MSGTINDISNLRFYTDKGILLNAHILYILTWEIIPCETVRRYINGNPTGYFIGDVDTSDTKNIKIADDKFYAYVSDGGQIKVLFNNGKRKTDDLGLCIFSYDEEATPKDYNEYIGNILFYKGNKVKVTIHIQNNEYFHTYDIEEVFNYLPYKIASIDDGQEQAEAFNRYITDDKLYTVNTVYTGNNLGSDKEYYQTLHINNVNLSTDVNGKALILQVLEENIPNLGMYFPFVRYTMDFYQDKVSTDFISANTLIIMEYDANNAQPYVKPYIASDNRYSLVFKPVNQDSELFIIDTSDNYSVIKKNEISFSLADNDNPDTKSVNPLSFAFGVESPIEGAYVNPLGIYMKSLDSNFMFFMGAIVVKTLIIGEDERFRTLLGNFGVVDPINYPNIFGEQDFAEECVDNILINNKSKELFLTYNEIFSYVGTYKALVRAIKFLGYNDIVFKEWYTIKDSNDKETDIATQVYDIENDVFLAPKLALFGISVEDFKRYNKLNKLSMVYHINDIDDSLDIQTVLIAKNGNGSDNTSESFDMYFDVPLTKPIAMYRTDEIMSKLFSVKKWLESNVIGVNAYITDITGEGIYFGALKTQGYHTSHILNDYSSEMYCTPDAKCILPFKHSKGKIICTLTEFHDAVKFSDYEQVTFGMFEKFSKPISMSASVPLNLYMKNYQGQTVFTSDNSTLHISNTVESPITADEVNYELHNVADSGTLYEWTEEDKGLIYYHDGELTILFEDTNEAVFKEDCLPIITLENANIHRCFGAWRENIEWTIRETIDLNTGNLNYRMKNIGKYVTDSYSVNLNNYFILIPDESKTERFLKYTENNKWNMPLFVMKGYKIATPLSSDNTFGYLNADKKELFDISNGEYIIEIIKGDMLFKNINGKSATLSFSSDTLNNNNEAESVSANEQHISISYMFKSSRENITSVDIKNIVQSSSTQRKYDDIAQLISLNENSILTFYRLMLDTRRKHLNIADEENTALQEAYSFLQSSDFNSELEKFIELQASNQALKKLYEELNDIYLNNYKCNKNIEVEVNQLGDYEIVAKAYDRYNNMFVNKYDKYAYMTAKPMEIDTYMYQLNSSNEPNFYRRNTNGELCNDTLIKRLKEECDSQALFPKSYFVSDIDYDLALNRIDFDNISYAIDTPKNNDYITFDNFTERCTGGSADTTTYTFKMLDENPDKCNLYIGNTADSSYKLNLIVFDTVLQEVVYQKENLCVIECNKVEAKEDINYADDSYIKIQADQETVAEINEEMQKYFTDRRYKVYIMNASEHNITNEMIYGYNLEEYTTLILFDRKYFNIEDVVKVRYYIPMTADDIAINETAYRVIDCQADNSREGYYIYTLNGLLNIELMQNYQLNTLTEEQYNTQIGIRAVIMYASNLPVHYQSKVVGDGYEYNYNLGNNNYILRDTFRYNDSKLLLNDYIDDTFSIRLYDYDMYYLNKEWFDATAEGVLSEDTELYRYHGFPCTIPQGRQILFTSHDDEEVFGTKYHVKWTLRNRTFDDVENWEGHVNTNDKEIVFRSVNKTLSFRPELLGVQDLELECIDLYGNRIVNNGSGLFKIVEK